ncbi:MAG: hypothetical protein COA79_17505 [Planctomycetota bacterium]|nr:MAG: hypothetical protein COA79_17505 [Planctomycetota bacterium]
MNHIIDTHIIDTIVKICIKQYGNKIVSIYVVGSFSRGDSIDTSDLDLKIIFEDDVELDEIGYWEFVRDVKFRIHENIDLSPQWISKIKEWGVGIKYDGKLLYGKDIRNEIKDPEICEYIKKLKSISKQFSKKMRGLNEIDYRNLKYPDEKDEFYGYIRYEDKFKQLSRLFSLSFISTAKIAIHGNVIVKSKRTIPELYVKHVDDAFNGWVKNLFYICRDQWHYRIPENNIDRIKLKDICSKALDFEKDFYIKCI